MRHLQTVSDDDDDEEDEEEEEEDVSSATVYARHLRSEELERLRFIAHQSAGGGRHGGNARTRQRHGITGGGALSAGTNTPGTCTLCAKSPVDWICCTTRVRKYGTYSLQATSND